MCFLNLGRYDRKGFGNDVLKRRLTDIFLIDVGSEEIRVGSN